MTADPRPLTRGDLVRFDVTRGLPTALRVLRRRLGPMTLARALGRMVLAAPRDPLAGVDASGWEADREMLVRHQLGAAVRLDDALMPLLPDQERVEIIAEVISETGAAFLESALQMPALDAWSRATGAERRAFLEGTFALFFNMRATAVESTERRLGFDVSACRFAQLTRAIGRPYLGPAFCAADAVYFGRPNAPATLTRTGTLATGGDRCDFRFELR